jgi:hypothetical protein
MSTESDAVPETVAEPLPLGQRLYDNWPLLMVAGIGIMALIYTGWGLFEILTMPNAQLP